MLCLSVFGLFFKLLFSLFSINNTHILKSVGIKNPAVCDAIPVCFLIKATWELVHTYLLNWQQRYSRMLP